MLSVFFHNLKKLCNSLTKSITLVVLYKTSTVICLTYFLLLKMHNLNFHIFTSEVNSREQNVKLLFKLLCIILINILVYDVMSHAIYFVILGRNTYITYFQNVIELTLTARCNFVFIKIKKHSILCYIPKQFQKLLLLGNTGKEVHV